MPYIIALLHSADISHIGRFNVNHLTQQERMELMIENINTQTKFRRPRGGDFLDITAWPGVTCNDQGEVTYVENPWQSDDYAGTMHFQWLPPTVRNICIEHGGIEGTFSASDFPRKMFAIMLQANALTGSIDTAKLPETLNELNLYQNAISGTIDLCTLPPSLEFLTLYENAITGTVDLQHLPETIAAINMEDNKLFGDLIVQGLPTSLYMLNLSANSFEGKLHVGDNVFENLTNLLLQYNAFEQVEFSGRVPENAVFKIE